MKILDAGHKYALQHLENAGEQTLTFGKRSGSPVQHETEYPGTTTQEVIRAAIDRTKYVDALLPCQENYRAILLLREALYWLERRAYLRKRQQLAQVNQSHADSGSMPFTAHEIEAVPICIICGHISCFDHQLPDDHLGDKDD